jgi:hypothetical protein
MKIGYDIITLFNNYNFKNRFIETCSTLVVIIFLSTH